MYSDQVVFITLWYAAVLDYLQTYILERCMLNMETGCWDWTRSTDGRYGQAYVFGQKIKAHRLAFLAWGGSFKRHHVGAHKCDRTICCAPYHIDNVPQWENVKHIWNRGRRGPATFGRDNGQVLPTHG